MSVKFRDSQWDESGIIAKMLSKIELPKMAHIEQLFDSKRIEDVPSAVKEQFSKPKIRAGIKPGARIAVTVGSRGIANIDIIIKTIVDNIKALKGNPFIVPAMGSHGSATPEGQREVLEELGITEEYVGAPIISSLEVKPVGVTPQGKPVYMDKHAAEADGIIVAGRIKPHTAFRGEYESGLYKMMVIGLGNQAGAESCHDEGFGRMAEIIPEMARIIMKNTNILAGVAIIENAFDDTCIIETVPAEDIDKREPQLLLKAKALMPEIKFHDIDVLIVDRIGKNYSGDGMDPNITSTYCTPYASGGPAVQKCVVLDISDQTHGNAIGVGMSDFSTKRLFDKYDFDAAYINGLTCTVTKGAHVPLILKNDKLAISAAVHTAIGIDRKNPRIVRIENTSHINRIYISEALKKEAAVDTEIRMLDEYKPFAFDRDGNLF